VVARARSRPLLRRDLRLLAHPLRPPSQARLLRPLRQDVRCRRPRVGRFRRLLGGQCLHRVGRFRRLLVKHICRVLVRRVAPQVAVVLVVPVAARVPVAAIRLVPVVVLVAHAKAATPVVPAVVNVPVVDPEVLVVPVEAPAVPVLVGVRVGNVAHRVVPVGGVVVATRTSCNHSS
jgi:hypothetical protein